MPTIDSLFQTWTNEQQKLFKTTIHTLKQHGIINDNDLLLTDPHQTSQRTNIPLSILVALKQQLVQSFQLSIITDQNEINEKGTVLYIKNRYIPTAIPSLDKLLKGGGFLMGEMIEIQSDQPELLEKISLKVMKSFLQTYSKGKIHHIDTMGFYQSKLSTIGSNELLSRITCYKAFKMKNILQLLEQIGAIQFSIIHSNTPKIDQEPILIIIQEIGYLLNSDWDVSQEQGNCKKNKLKKVSDQNKNNISKLSLIHLLV
ncbi:hypothetical protein BJ944DRAFT_270924 [Cunninghamella echinulata]|nr:hypothetical protein BJ944DRAFT_270924 [Cunninghamella echinulata]